MRLPSITDRDFDRMIEQATGPVLVEFWRSGCGHCRALMVELEAAQEDVGDALRIVTMNVDDNFQIPAELEIHALPTLALYRNGRFERFIGGLGTKSEILAQINLA